MKHWCFVCLKSCEAFALIFTFDKFSDAVYMCIIDSLKRLCVIYLHMSLSVPEIVSCVQLQLARDGMLSS